MASETIYIVLPFAKQRGRLRPAQAERVKSPEVAKRRAESVAASKGGAIAFARTGDADTGEFDHSELLGSYGTVPDELDDFLNA